MKHWWLIMILGMFVAASFQASAMTITRTGDVSISAEVVNSATQLSSTNTSSGGRRRLQVPTDQVIITGYGYPNQPVHVLLDGVEQAVIDPGDDARFEVRLSEINHSDFLLSLWSRDQNQDRSPLQSFYIEKDPSVLTEVNTIFIPPSVSEPVISDTSVTWSGYTVPGAVVFLELYSSAFETGVPFRYQTVADNQGAWSFAFFAETLPAGVYAARVRAAAPDAVSQWSQLNQFRLFEDELNQIQVDQQGQALRGDVNLDGRIDIVDLSIAAFYYEQPLDAGAREFERQVLNGDGQINLADFSIIAFYWTG